MNIGIIGSGNIGGTLATLLTATGHDVMLANSRGPDSLRETVEGNDRLQAGTASEAAQFGEVVMEAIPLKAIPGLPTDDLEGKILVSAANYYPDRDGQIDLGGLSQTGWVAQQVPGARVVKAFNTIWFRHLAERGDTTKPEDERRAILLAGDDEEAKATVADLIRELGFAPVDTGTLEESTRQEPGQPLYNADVTGAEARRQLSS